MKKNGMFAVVGMAVLAVALTGSEAKAAANPAFQGNFTLSSAASWGMANLPAGNYSFTVDTDYAGSVVTILQGTRTVARVQAVGLNTIKSGTAEILIVGGAVRAMNAPEIGVSFHYATSKSSHRTSPQQPVLAQTIPVAAARAGR